MIAAVAAALVLSAGQLQVPPQAASGLTQVRTRAIDGSRTLIMGVNAKHEAVLRLVDSLSGVVRGEVSGMSLRLFLPSGYVLIRRGESWYAFDLTQGRVEGPLSPVDLAIRNVRDAAAPLRTQALNSLRTDAIIRDDPHVREALIERLRKDVGSGSVREAPRSPRAAEQDRYALEVLIAIVGMTRDVRALPLLVNTDAITTAGALMDI